MVKRMDGIEARRLDGVEVKEVIVTKVLRGTGEMKDPNRHVYQYWDLDGRFLAESYDVGPDVSISLAEEEKRPKDN